MHTSKNIFKIHYTITIFIYINYLKLYSLHKTHERMINMGGTVKNIDIKQQLEASADFCSQLNEKKDTILDFLFLIDWLKDAVKKKKGIPRIQHVKKLWDNMKPKWDSAMLKIKHGKETNEISFGDFVTIYCGLSGAKNLEKTLSFMGAYGVKKYTPLVTWVKTKTKEMKSQLTSLTSNIIESLDNCIQTMMQIKSAVKSSSTVFAGTKNVKENDNEINTEKVKKHFLSKKIKTKKATTKVKPNE